MDETTTSTTPESTSKRSSGSMGLLALLSVLLAAFAFWYCYFLWNKYQSVEAELNSLKSAEQLYEYNYQAMQAYLDSLARADMEPRSVVRTTSKPAMTPKGGDQPKAAPTLKPIDDRNRSYSIQVGQATYDVYMLRVEGSDIRILQNNANGIPLMNFSNLKQEVNLQGKQLLFATNGGIFHPNLNPVGLYVANGRELSPLNLKDGTGNFYLKPNGVFYITKAGRAGIIQSEDYPKVASSVDYATQSGPMLVQYGALHPAFEQGSSNRFIRSGVGMINDNTLVFVISKEPVNFYEFAAVFKDHFGCWNALYLDGGISKMYLPALQRYEMDGQFGLLIGVLQ
ncbi:MAG: phosphodiester glycosidase family protein [Phaeodactylibacter sp.]|nr:phosphodiester glycosidase family protein [Phaeodactylibacter sp.]